MDLQFYRAAKLGDITLLRRLVNEDPSRLLRVIPQAENTAFHVSVSFGHIEIVKAVYAVLLQHNSSLEGDTNYSKSLSLLTQVNSKGDTALHVAAREGHTSVAEFLIQKILPWHSDNDVESGSNSSSSLAREKIRMRNKTKNTALHEAVRSNNLVMVNLLTGADPDLGHPNYDVDVEGGESPLFLAARSGSSKILNQIFRICPSPAHDGQHGRTALHVAVVEGHLGVVKMLLEKEREIVNKVDENGRTALHYAVSKTWGHKIVKQLLMHDTSSVYKLDKDGLSPLHIAAFGSSIKVFKELIQCCPDSVELLDKKCRNVLHFAVISKNYKKIRYVLQQLELKEIVNQPDDDGNTPLHHAAKQCDLGHMGLLCSNRRVDLKAMNNNGETAIDIYIMNLIPIDRLAVTLSLSMINLHTKTTASARADYALSVRGEEKWIIGGVIEEEIDNDSNKQEEVATARSDVKQWEKKMGKILHIVASLTATTGTFADVFQVIGSYNSVDGKPILLDKGSFQKFLQYYAIAMRRSWIAFLFVMLIIELVDCELFYFFLLKLARIFIYVGLKLIAFLEGSRHRYLILLVFSVFLSMSS